MSAGTIVRPSRAPVLTAPRIDGTVVIFVVVCAAQFAFGVWMSSRGLRWGDAFYGVYPLFAAAGWGLYEIATSRRRGRATALVLAGWVRAIPACLLVMANPRLGVQEYPELKALVQGGDALELGYGDPVVTRAKLAGYRDTRVIAKDHRLLLDADRGAALAAQVLQRTRRGS